MSIDPIPFIRKSFIVQAVQVTDKNMHEVAEWCGGSMERSTRSTDRGKDIWFVRLPVPENGIKRQTTAYVGDWVLQSNNFFKIYDKKSFDGVFVPVQSRLKQVLNYLAMAMLKQDNCTTLQLPVEEGFIEKLAMKIIKL